MVAMLVAFFCELDGATKIPPAIENMIGNRLAVVCGDIRWTHEIADRLPGRHFEHRNRYALDGSRAFERFGDQNGWVDYDFRDGTPQSRVPEIILETEFGLWQYRATKSIVDLWLPQPTDPHTMSSPPDGEELRDVRWLGAYPDSTLIFLFGEGAFTGDLPPRYESFAPAKWSVSQSGKLHEVTTELASGRKLKWWINEDRGWNPERIVAEEFAGNPEIEVRAALEEYDGVWFPKEVELSAGGRVFERFRVKAAKFDGAAGIEKLTVSELNLEPGVNVNFKNAAPGDPRNMVHIWNGDAAVDLKTWKRQVTSGERQYGPRFKKMQQTGQPDTTYMTDDELERWRAHSIAMPEQSARGTLANVWERHVADFCVAYRLDDAQRQKAWLILEECQKAGTEYLDRRKADFASAQRSLMKSRAAGDADGMKAAQTKLTELFAPFTAIFELQLKPRLEQLPTRAQRSATSQPTSEASTKPTRD